MSLYETVCVIRPEIQGAALKKITDKIEKILKDNKASEVRQNDWGLRKLAYPISRLKTAHYLQYVYEGGGDLVSSLEKQLNYEDLILRYLTVRVAKGIDPNKLPDEFQFGKVDDFRFFKKRPFAEDRRPSFSKSSSRKSEEEKTGEDDSFGDKMPSEDQD